MKLEGNGGNYVLL